MLYRILGYFGVVIFRHFGSDGYSFILASLISPLVVMWRNIYIIDYSGACDKHVSFLCVVFVSEEYSRELRIYFCVCELSFLVCAGSP